MASCLPVSALVRLADVPTAVTLLRRHKASSPLQAACCARLAELLGRGGPSDCHAAAARCGAALAVCEVHGRYTGDMGEIWGRCGGDMGEIWGRYRVRRGAGRVRGHGGPPESYPYSYSYPWPYP